MAVNYIDIAPNASTKASLTTLTQLNDGQVVHLLGYYAAGDGGGQSLVYNLTGRTGITVDSGFYFTGPGSDDYFEAVNKKVANVLQWGAKGDGSTDDTTRTFVVIFRRPSYLAISS